MTDSQPSPTVAAAPQHAPLERPSLITKLFMAIVRWAERLNVKYSAVGNPPIYDNAVFPWVAEIEKACPAIRAELDRLLERSEELPSFHDISTDVAKISKDRQWKTFLLAGYGISSQRSIAECPQTWQACQKIPGLTTAMFSIMEPGTHLPAHTGPYNGVLRLHLGLIVPEPRDRTAIRVTDQVYHWREGEVVIFDDSYEHEAWNRTDAVRVVLFVDFVRPLRFPASLLNRLLLKLAIFTPFVQEGYQAHKAWEKIFYGR
jgi:aspartyl/asparaginyl beta-hydroxylase (cupin superfamily)